MGMMCFRAPIPSILVGRLGRLLTSADESVTRTANTSTCRHLMDKLTKWTEEYMFGKKRIAATLSEKLERSNSGSGLRRIQEARYPVSGLIGRRLSGLDGSIARSRNLRVMRCQ